MTTPPVLIISCYALGHQPLDLARPLAFLRQAGIEAAGLDLAVQPFDEHAARVARFVGIAAPMQTALRLGVAAAQRVRAANPHAHIAFFGLYAWLNRAFLLAHGADSVLGGESDEALWELAQAVLAGQTVDTIAGVATLRADSAPRLERIRLPVADRSTLPPLDAYARYLNGGPPQLVGHTEATTGCQHLCRHCPIVPIYRGRLFVVPVETVLADIRQQARAGATHMVFGDADFLNGPTHSLRITRALHAEWPQMTFDFTTKVEHILEYQGLFPEFAELGCTFVTTAIESLSDHVLEQLGKGHTAADVSHALRVLSHAGLAVQATLVAFTPWTTLADYLALTDFIAMRRLQEGIRPVQLSIRLLVPPGSLLTQQPEAGVWLGELDGANFGYRWRHPDPRMEELQEAVSNLVAEADATGEPVEETHARIRTLAYQTAHQAPPSDVPVAKRVLKRAPRLSENWFC